MMIKKAAGLALSLAVMAQLNAGTFAFAEEPTADFNIVNGQFEDAKNYPEVVLVKVYASQNSYFTCGGTILDDKWVLTAAHCFHFLGQYKWPTYVESYTPYSLADSGIQYSYTHLVNRVFINPQYFWEEKKVGYQDKGRHDVAVLRLDKPISSAQPIDPQTGKTLERQTKTGLTVPKVNLADSGEPIPRSGDARVVGRGADSWVSTPGGESKGYYKKDSSFLRSAKVPVNADCKADSMICAEERIDYEKNGHLKTNERHDRFNHRNPASCHGDSGGPLFNYGANGERRQIGIVSHSRTTEEESAFWEDDTCGHISTFYTSLSFVRPWVEYVVNLDSKEKYGNPDLELKQPPYGDFASGAKNGSPFGGKPGEGGGAGFGMGNGDRPGSFPQVPTPPRNGGQSTPSVPNKPPVQNTPQLPPQPPQQVPPPSQQPPQPPQSPREQGPSQPLPPVAPVPPQQGGTGGGAPAAPAPGPAPAPAPGPVPAPAPPAQPPAAQPPADRKPQDTGSGKVLPSAPDDPAILKSIPAPSNSAISWNVPVANPQVGSELAIGINRLRETFAAGPNGRAYKGRSRVASQGVALLASEAKMADALASGVLQGQAPLYLTNPQTLEDTVLKELKASGVSEVWLLGGPAALSPAVEDALKANGLKTKRLAGSDRTQTAVEIAKAAQAQPLGRFVGRAFGSQGDETRSWADSIALGALSAKTGIPTLLTASDQLSASVQGELAQGSVTTVIGGNAAVSPVVAEQIQALTSKAPKRIAGANRADTAKQIAAEFKGADRAIVIDGQGQNAWQLGFSLAGLANDLNAPILLTYGQVVPEETKAALKDMKLDNVICIGEHATCNAVAAATGK